MMSLQIGNTRQLARTVASLWTALAIVVAGTVTSTFAQPPAPKSPAPPAPAAPAAGGNASALDQANQEADAAYQRGDFVRCIELTTANIAKNPKDHVAYYWRASARIELGRLRRDTREIRAGIEDSREALKAANVADPNYYLPYMYGMNSLAEIERRAEHADQCVQVADKLLAKTTLKPEERANVLFQRGGANLAAGRFDAAIKDYQGALTESPEHLAAHIQLAQTFSAAKRFDEALMAYGATIKAFPNNPLTYNNRGLFLQNRGNNKDAFADFNKAIELDPKFVVAYANRGFTSLNSGEPAQAETDFSAAIKLDPNNPMVYSLRATSLLSQGKAAEAVADFQRVIQFDPNSPVAKADLAFAKLFMKDLPGSAELFQQALTAEPNLRFLTPWKLWVDTLLGKGDAAAVAKASLEKPAAERDWTDQVLIYLANKQTDQELIAAVSKTEASLKVAELCEAYYFIGERARLAGQADVANGFYKQALSTKAYQLSAFRGAQYATNAFPPPK